MASWHRSMAASITTPRLLSKRRKPNTSRWAEDPDQDLSKDNGKGTGMGGWVHACCQEIWNLCTKDACNHITYVLMRSSRVKTYVSHVHFLRHFHGVRGTCKSWSNRWAVLWRWWKPWSRWGWWWERRDVKQVFGDVLKLWTVLFYMALFKREHHSHPLKLL